MNKKFSKIILILFVLPILLNISACNSKIIITDNISKDKKEPEDNKDPNEKDKENKKDEDKLDPDKIKKDYDEKWNWKDNEKEILQFIKNFQIEVKDKWLELAAENPILDDGKNLLTITYSQEDLDKESKYDQHYNSGEWLIYDRFLTQIAKTNNWIIDGHREDISNKIYKKNLLYRNQWHKNISRNEAKYGGNHSDGIWIGFDFQEVTSKYVDRFLNYYIVKKNNNFLTLYETEFSYSPWNYMEKDKRMKLKDKNIYYVYFDKK